MFVQPVGKEIMANGAVVGATLSKLAFADLLLDAAVELERARNGATVSRAPLERLAKFIAHLSNPFEESGQATFVDPTYYDSLERLFRLQKADSLQSTAQLQAFLADAVAELRLVERGQVEPASISKMIDFCIRLHQELTREIEVETGIVVDEWRTSDDVSVAQGLG